MREDDEFLREKFPPARISMVSEIEKEREKEERKNDKRKGEER